jgi:hypothetical protein
LPLINPVEAALISAVMGGGEQPLSGIAIYLHVRAALASVCLGPCACLSESSHDANSDVGP